MAIIIDVNSIASIAHYAGGPGIFFNMVNRAIEITGTNAAFFVADADGPYFRHTLYPAYKGNRPSDPDRKVTIQRLITALRNSGIPVLQVDTLEADDLIANIVRMRSNPLGTKDWIFTKDRDMWALLTWANVLTHDYTVVTEKLCLEKLGVGSMAIPELKALAGDSGDNIPGMRGIGPKGAVKLITEHGSLGAIYSHMAQLPKATQKKLKAENPIKWLALIRPRYQNDLVIPPVYTVTDEFDAASKELRKLIEYAKLQNAAADQLSGIVRL